jgi:hypothetical protein
MRINFFSIFEFIIMLSISILQFEGFVDLGDYTPKKQKSELGDHGLVFMFRPFKGNWVQAIGCFLSKNNADANVLAKLTIEAIALLENAGFFVDGVVCDGASWNRKMWEKFGMDEKSGTSRHPMISENRRLHFFSDFPHLIKCVRKFVIEAEEFMVRKF